MVWQVSDVNLITKEIIHVSKSVADLFSTALLSGVLVWSGGITAAIAANLFTKVNQTSVLVSGSGCPV